MSGQEPFSDAGYKGGDEFTDSGDNTNNGPANAGNNSKNEPGNSDPTEVADSEGNTTNEPGSNSDGNANNEPSNSDGNTGDESSNNLKWDSTTNEFSNLDSDGYTINNNSDNSIHPVETEFLAADGRQNLLTHIIGPTRLKVDLKSTAYGYIPLPKPLAPTSSIRRLISDDPESTPDSSPIPDPESEGEFLEKIPATLLHPKSFTLDAKEFGTYYNPNIFFENYPLYTSFANIPGQHIRDDFIEVVYKLLIARCEREDIVFLPMAFHDTLHRLDPGVQLEDFEIMELLIPGGCEEMPEAPRRYWGAVQNMNNVHWIFTVFDRVDKILYIFDSLNSNYEDEGNFGEATRYIRSLAGQEQEIQGNEMILALGLTEDPPLNKSTVDEVEVRSITVLGQRDMNSCGLHALANMQMFLNLVEDQDEGDIEFDELFPVGGEMIHDDEGNTAEEMERNLRTSMIKLFEQAELFATRDEWRKVAQEQSTNVPDDDEPENVESKTSTLKQPSPYIRYVFGQKQFIEHALPTLKRSILNIKQNNNPCAIVVEMGTGFSNNPADYDIFCMDKYNQLNLYRNYHYPIFTDPNIEFISTTTPYEFRDFRNIRPNEEHNFEMFESFDFDVALQAQMRNIRIIQGNFHHLALPKREYNNLALNVLLRRTAKVCLFTDGKGHTYLKSGYMGRRVKDYRTAVAKEEPFEWGLYLNGQPIQGGQIYGPLGEWAVIGVDGAYFLYMRGPGVEPYDLKNCRVEEVTRDESLRSPRNWGYEAEVNEAEYSDPAEIGRREKAVAEKVDFYQKAWRDRQIKLQEYEMKKKEMGHRRMINEEEDIKKNGQPARERAAKLRMLRELEKWVDERQKMQSLIKAMEEDNLEMRLAKANAVALYKTACEEGAKTKLELERKIKATQAELEDKAEELKLTQETLDSCLTGENAPERKDKSTQVDDKGNSGKAAELREDLELLQSQFDLLEDTLETLKTEHTLCEKNISTLKTALDNSKEEVSKASEQELEATIELFCKESDLMAAKQLLESTQSELIAIKAALEREKADHELSKKRKRTPDLTVNQPERPTKIRILNTSLSGNPTATAGTHHYASDQYYLTSCPPHFQKVGAALSLPSSITSSPKLMLLRALALHCPVTIYPAAHFHHHHRPIHDLTEHLNLVHRTQRKYHRGRKPIAKSKLTNPDAIRSVMEGAAEKLIEKGNFVLLDKLRRGETLRLFWGDQDVIPCSLGVCHPAVTPMLKGVFEVCPEGCSARITHDCDITACETRSAVHKEGEEEVEKMKLQVAHVMDYYYPVLSTLFESRLAFEIAVFEEISTLARSAIELAPSWWRPTLRPTGKASLQGLVKIFDREVQWVKLGAEVKKAIQEWPEWVVARNTERMEKIAYAHKLRIARAVADGSHSANMGGGGGVGGGGGGPRAGCFITVKDNNMTCEVEKAGETDVEMDQDEAVKEPGQKETEAESESLGSLGVHIIDSA